MLLQTATTNNKQECMATGSFFVMMEILVFYIDCCDAMIDDGILPLWTKDTSSDNDVTLITRISFPLDPAATPASRLSRRMAKNRRML